MVGKASIKTVVFQANIILTRSLVKLYHQFFLLQNIKNKDNK